MTLVLKVFIFLPKFNSIASDIKCFEKADLSTTKFSGFFANHADVNDVSFVIGWICFLHLEFTFIFISPKKRYFQQKKIYENGFFLETYQHKPTPFRTLLL